MLGVGLASAEQEKRREAYARLIGADLQPVHARLIDESNLDCG